MASSSQEKNIVPRKPGTLSTVSGLIKRGLGLSEKINSSNISSLSNIEFDKILVLLLDHARNKYPEGGWHVDFINHRLCGNLNGREHAMGKDSFPQLSDPADIGLAIERFEDILQCFQQGVGEPSRDSLQSVQANLRPYLKMVMDKKYDDMEFVYKRFLAESNVITYLAIDTEKDIMHVNSAHLKNWRADINQLFRIAEANLIKTIDAKKFELMSAVNGLSYCYGDGYDASRMVLPEFRALICKKLRRTDFLFGMPNREFVLAFYPSNQYHFDQIHNQIMKDFLSHSHRISPNIFGADENGDLWIEKKITKITANSRTYSIGEGG